FAARGVNGREDEQKHAEQQKQCDTADIDDAPGHERQETSNPLEKRKITVFAVRFFNDFAVILKCSQPRPCSHLRVKDAVCPLLTPQELAAAGQALYGAGWRAALAHAFQVTETVVAMVESGRAPAPLDWRARLVALAHDTALRALAAANDLLWREGD